MHELLDRFDHGDKTITFNQLANELTVNIPQATINLSRKENVTKSRSTSAARIGPKKKY